MSNTPIELLLTLGVNDKPSRDNINAYIEKLSNELRSKPIYVTLQADGIKKVEQQTEQIGKQIVDKLKDSSKKAGEQIKSELSKGTDDAKKQVRRSLEELGKLTFNSFEELKKGVRQLGESVDFSIDLEVDEDGKQEIARVFADIRKNANERYRIVFQPVVDEGTGLRTGAFQSSDLVRLRDTSFKNLEAGIRNVKSELKELEHQGIVVQREIDRFRQRLEKIDDVDSLEKLKYELREVVRESERENEILKKSERLRKKQIDALAQLERIVKRFPKTVDFDLAGQIEKDLRSLQVTNFRNIFEIDKTSEIIDKLRGKINLLGAEATEASKNAMGIVEAFKIAMERFPIWMAASTAFYGTVRSIRSAVRQIVEIDSQLTVLRRVSADATNVNAVLEDSVEIARRLGNEIREINEGFIEFARQGYTGVDLTEMVEFATLLGNISDLSIEESASILTAALKGFNLEASETIRVVDALNEVDNNYAITTRQLAEAIQRSAGAAYTYGVTLEETIGYATAIGQVTRESGSVIGCHKQAA